MILLYRFYFFAEAFWRFFGFKCILMGCWSLKSLSHSSKVCHVDVDTFQAFFFHSFWDLCDSWYNEWISIESWTFWILYNETLDLIHTFWFNWVALTLLQQKMGVTPPYSGFSPSLHWQLKGLDSFLVLSGWEFQLSTMPPLTPPGERIVFCYFF